MGQCKLYFITIHLLIPRPIFRTFTLNHLCPFSSQRDRYTENRQLNIDNNRTERAVKPFVIWRKTGCLTTTTVAQRRVPFCIVS
ncbi:IS66 family transposase [Shewanella sp. HL-SH4]|uniref:IS66 family transposase n=1 Tax=Shewanella sp. HL-SH4 TaxID=3436240 RepID=UPI003EC09412